MLNNCGLAKTMITKKQIRKFSRRLAREFKPEKIVLFGSYSGGKPTPGSDVDLLVVMDHQGRPADQSVEIRLKLRPDFPLDLLVRSPRVIRERLALGDSFIKEILEKGQVLYEADHA